MIIIKKTLIDHYWVYLGEICLVFIPEEYKDPLTHFSFILHELGHIYEERKEEKYRTFGKCFKNLLNEVDATVYAFKCVKEKYWDEMIPHFTLALLSHIKGNVLLHLHTLADDDLCYRILKILNTRFLRLIKKE